MTDTPIVTVTELAGVKGARMYPGSWSDWCQQGGEVATGDQ
jgi:3-mercaptopyruvate sulfurtransferase SseA